MKTEIITPAVTVEAVSIDTKKIVKLVAEAHTLNIQLKKVDTLSVKWCIHVIAANLNKDELTKLKQDVNDFMSESFIKKAFSLINNVNKYNINLVQLDGLSFAKAVEFCSAQKSPEKMAVLETKEAIKTETKEAIKTATKEVIKEAIKPTLKPTLKATKEAVNVMAMSIDTSAKYPILKAFDEVMLSLEITREELRKASLGGIDEAKQGAIISLLSQISNIEATIYDTL